MAYFMTALLLIMRLTFSLNDLPRTVPSGDKVDGNIATITSDIRVDGEVIGDVTTWTGTIVVSGRVHGDVVSYTGDIVLTPGAQIDGNAMSLGGKIQADSAIIDGTKIIGGVGGKYLSQLVGLFAPVPYGATNTAGIAGWPFSLALGMLLLILCLLPIGVWPHRTATTAVMLTYYPVRAMIIGLLASIALTTLLPLIVTLLAITLIGLPLSVIIVVLANVPYISGLAALIQAARASIEPRTIRLTRTTILVATSLILPIALVGMLSPSVALLLFYVIASPGLGALLLSRVGTVRSIQMR